jgi:type IV secretory pathway protease TraF
VDAFRQILFLRRGFSSSYRIALPRTGRIAKRALFPVVLCAGIAVPVLSFELLGLRIGLTDSACPPGIYRMVNRAPSRGDLVLACLPDAIAQFGQARGYLSSGRGYGNGVEPVGKRLSALPGDVVEVMPDYVSVNGQRLEHSASLTRDSRGRSVQHVERGPLHGATKSGLAVRNQRRAKLGLSLLRAGAGELRSSRAGAGSHVVKLLTLSEKSVIRHTQVVRHTRRG